MFNFAKKIDMLFLKLFDLHKHRQRHTLSSFPEVEEDVQGRRQVLPQGRQGVHLRTDRRRRGGWCDGPQGLRRPDRGRWLHHRLGSRRSPCTSCGGRRGCWSRGWWRWRLGHAGSWHPLLSRGWCLSRPPPRS